MLVGRLIQVQDPADRAKRHNNDHRFFIIVDLVLTSLVDKAKEINIATIIERVKPLKRPKVAHGQP